MTLSSARALLLEDASRIDVSGGATVATNGVVKGTDAGSIVLESDAQRTDTSGASRIHLGAALRGDSLAGGGTLAVRGLDSVRVVAQSSPRGVAGGAAPGSLLLSQPFFENGAFGNYDIRAANGLQVDAGVSLAPRASNWLANDTAATTASGTPMASVYERGQLVDSQRRPVSVALSALNTFSTVAPRGSLTSRCGRADRGRPARLGDADGGARPRRAGQDRRAGRQRDAGLARLARLQLRRCPRHGNAAAGLRSDRRRVGDHRAAAEYVGLPAGHRPRAAAESTSGSTASTRA